jgi:predicted transcriptional regulator
MNSKKMKVIRYKAKHILVEWLRSLLSKEEAEKIVYENVLSFLPNKTHYYQGSTIKLQPWSFKWIIKKLKHNSELTYTQLNDMLQPTAKQLQRIEQEGIKLND